LFVAGSRCGVLGPGGGARLPARPPAARAPMAATLRAYLDHRGNAPAMAEALHVHPQTVRYRLRRLRELFGDALEDPEARFELEAAVRVPRPV
jgi:DNA-binding PucR family transcriptional regulator